MNWRGQPQRPGSILRGKRVAAGMTRSALAQCIFSIPPNQCINVFPRNAFPGPRPEDDLVAVIAVFEDADSWSRDQKLLPGFVERCIRCLDAAASSLLDAGHFVLACSHFGFPDDPQDPNDSGAGATSPNDSNNDLSGNFEEGGDQS